MTTPTIAELLKYADLQMAAEAFLRVNKTGDVIQNGAALVEALVKGNDHASKFSEIQANNFAAHWKVLDQRANTPTGFSGTLSQCIQDDPATGAKAGELVMSFRSTEFIDDAARDNQATNALEIKETGFAWGQLRDMEAWYADLIASGKLAASQAVNVTGYSLGGHLATAFNLLNPTAAQQTITFNGAGVGQIKQGNLAQALVDFNALRASPELIATRLQDSTLAMQYQVIRTHLTDKSWTVRQTQNYLEAANTTHFKETA